jgi:LysR family glycine cleavage system transcriptional activator
MENDPPPTAAQTSHDQVLGAAPPQSVVPHRAALPPFAALRAFDAVARLGGMRKAAQFLNIDHAVVSRHLRALENWTRTQLIERMHTGSVLTDAGLRYHQRIASAIDEIAQATLDLTFSPDPKRLEIWCMPGFASRWLVPRIGAFEAENPDLRIDVRPSDRAPDMQRHEAHIDIRYRAIYEPAITLPPGVRFIEIASPVVIPVATPTYLASRKPIGSVKDFMLFDLLHEDSFDNWRTWLLRHGLEPDVTIVGPKFWHGHLTVEAALRGRGIALVNHFLASDDLRSGALVEIGRGLFEPLSLGAYMFSAREDQWRFPPVANCRYWLLDAIERELGHSSARLVHD